MAFEKYVELTDTIESLQQEITKLKDIQLEKSEIPIESKLSKAIRIGNTLFKLALLAFSLSLSGVNINIRSN